MRNNQRYFLTCLFIGLLVMDAMAANVNVKTSRTLNKRQAKGVALNDGVYRAPKKHIAIVSNKKILLKAKCPEGSCDGKTRNIQFKAHDDCEAPEWTSLQNTFDDISIEKAKVGKICTTEKSVNYLTCEERTVDKLVPRHIAIGTMKEVNTQTGLLRSFDVAFRTQKEVEKTLHKVHPVYKTVEILKDVQVTVETLVPKHIIIHTLVSKPVTVQELTNYTVTLDKVVPKTEEKGVIKIVSAEVPALRSKDVAFRVKKAKKCSFRTEKSRQTDLRVSAHTHKRWRQTQHLRRVECEAGEEAY